jgi:hypothetical protein
VEEVLQVIRNRLSIDPPFPERSPLQVEGVMELLDIGLTTTHFQFEVILSAIKGMAMGNHYLR